MKAVTKPQAVATGRMHADYFVSLSSERESMVRSRAERDVPDSATLAPAATMQV